MIATELSSLAVPSPIPTPLSAPFWNGLAGGRFELQHCDSCSRWVFYPREICPHCWSPSLRWKAASGMGRLKTWSVQHKPGHPGWQPVTPFVIGLVQLDEGPTMLSQIVAAAAELKMNMRLGLRIVTVGDWRLPFFEAER